MLRGGSNAQEWAAKFIGMDEVFLRDVSRFWPSLRRRMGEESHENEITENLHHLIWNDEHARSQYYWIELQFVPLGESAEGLVSGKGYIDIAIFFDKRRKIYLAYECKRLNVVYDTGRQSLASDYVKEGMMRFVTEQYAESLPVGCMLGYVMDGDIVFAKERILTAMRNAEPSQIALLRGPHDIAAIGEIARFSTIHLRHGGGELEIRHALLPFR